MWLTSYDIETAWGPIEANLVSEARIGERTATIDQPKLVRLIG